jgi:hypothetical protein
MAVSSSGGGGGGGGSPAAAGRHHLDLHGTHSTPWGGGFTLGVAGSMITETVNVERSSLSATRSRMMPADDQMERHDIAHSSVWYRDCVTYCAGMLMPAGPSPAIRGAS